MRKQIPCAVPFSSCVHAFAVHVDALIAKARSTYGVILSHTPQLRAADLELLQRGTGPDAWYGQDAAQHEQILAVARETFVPET